LLIIEDISESIFEISNIACIDRIEHTIAEIYPTNADTFLMKVMTLQKS